MLDVICFQRDHNTGNYFVKIDKCRIIYGLSAHDNDEPGTFFAVPSVKFTSYSHNSPMVDNSGYINRPYLDRDVSYRVMNLSADEIREALSPHISGFEVIMCIMRARKLAETIRISVEAGKTKLLAHDEWTNETVAEELSGKYGMTYLKHFADTFKAQIA